MPARVPSADRPDAAGWSPGVGSSAHGLALSPPLPPLTAVTIFHSGAAQFLQPQRKRGIKFKCNSGTETVINTLELSGEQERFLRTVLVRVRFVEVRREKVLGLVVVGVGDHYVGSPGQSVVKVPQARLQVGGVTNCQGNSSNTLGIILTITITTNTCQKRFNVL